MNDEMLLMLYLDGLLDGEELENFEARLATDAELASALKAQRISGAYLRAEVSAALEERSFERLRDSVCASIDFSQESPSTQWSTPTKGLGDWFAELAVVWRAPLLSGLAAAAVTFLILRPAPLELSSGAPVAVELEEVRNPGGRMVLIRQPAEDEASPVIWLLEEESEEEETEGDEEEAQGAAGEGASSPQTPRAAEQHIPSVREAARTGGEPLPTQSTSPPQLEE